MAKRHRQQPNCSVKVAIGMILCLGLVTYLLLTTLMSSELGQVLGVMVREPHLLLTTTVPVHPEKELTERQRKTRKASIKAAIKAAKTAALANPSIEITGHPFATFNGVYNAVEEAEWLDHFPVYKSASANYLYHPLPKGWDITDPRYTGSTASTLLILQTGSY